jgi:hypothetical protein
MLHDYPALKPHYLEPLLFIVNFECCGPKW